MVQRSAVDSSRRRAEADTVGLKEVATIVRRILSSDQFTDVARTFRLVFAACHTWTLLWVVLLIVQGLLPAASVQITRLLVDGLTAAIGAGASWTTFRPVVMLAVLMAAVLVLIEILQLCSEWVRTIQSERIQDHIARLVHEKSMSADMSFFEMSAFYDHLHRARTDAANRPLALLESSGTVLQNGITLIAMAAVLLPYGLWLPPALLVSTLPAFYVVIRASRRYHTWWNDSTLTRRRIGYFETLLTEPFHAGELRLFDLGAHFRTGYQTLRTQFRNERLALLKAQYRSRLGAELVALAVSGAAMLWMFYQALLHLVTLGDLALFFQAFQRGQGLIKTLLGNLGQIYTNSLYVGNLFDFLALESKVVDAPDAIPAPDGLQSGINFRNVTFRYPGRSSPSLANFTAFFPAGKVTAIVGENGAGKTTLLKLLSRFYDPESGHVELDGIDVRRMSLVSLRKMITFMFQVPVNYQFTVRENVAFGNLEAAAEDGRLERAVWNAGADDIIRRLPKGFDSMLGRWFPEGTELSGGEWQRIALARAFMRQAQIILLDEPTSSMDSWAETDWYQRLRRYADNRTVILVTHRLTTAMRADLIHVMKTGQVTESGNHEQLLARGGLYAESWSSHLESASHTTEMQTATR
jgi:ATP-binding cassette subfamily B protein